MKINYFITITIGALAVFTIFFAGNTFSQLTGLANVQYPVEELGGCKNEADCKIYCDNPENADACLNFAQKNNLLSGEEISQAKKFLSSGSKGPGGCKGKDECEKYCNDMDNIKECISYAEKNNLMSPQELEEAKKVLAAISRGVKPPPCKGKDECDVYCEDPSHMEECITFGAEAGFIQGKELEDAQKMLQALKKGVKPPPCKGKDACDAYCSSPENMEVCMNFAMEAGMMSEQEKADSQKMLQALKKGVKPPNCKSKEACDAYCQQEDHFKECTDFAVAAGFMSEKDAEMARKTGGKGPGGCKNKEECDVFCNNPDNQETCFNFGKDNGLIPEEDLKKMEEGKQQMKQTLEQAPAEVLDCLKTEIGADTVEKMKNGFMPPREMGDKMQGCFQKMGPPPGEGGPGEGGMMTPGNQTGPGGCKTPEECKKYCEANPDGCKNFQPGPGTINPGNQMMPPQAGPGGCKTPEECQKYCQDNPDACKNSGPGPNGPSERRDINRVEGQMPPGQPCQGENCQRPSQGMQPGQELREGQELRPPEGQMPGQQPPPPPPGTSTEPGAGGNMAPGESVPQAPPAGQQQQQPQQPAPESAPPPPPPPPPPSAFLKPDSLVGSVLYIFAHAIYSLQK